MTRPEDEEFFSSIADGRTQRARRVRIWFLIGAGCLFALIVLGGVGVGLRQAESPPPASQEANQCALTANDEVEVVWNEFIADTSLDTDAEFFAFINQRTVDFAQRYPENTGEYAAFYYAFQDIEAAAAQGTLDEQPGKTKEELAANAIAKHCRAAYPN